jgi:hypothetical protein
MGVEPPFDHQFAAARVRDLQEHPALPARPPQPNRSTVRGSAPERPAPDPSAVGITFAVQGFGIGNHPCLGSFTSTDTVQFIARGLLDR